MLMNTFENIQPLNCSELFFLRGILVLSSQSRHSILYLSFGRFVLNFVLCCKYEGANHFASSTQIADLPRLIVFFIVCLVLDTLVVEVVSSCKRGRQFFKRQTNSSIFSFKWTLNLAPISGSLYSLGLAYLQVLLRKIKQSDFPEYTPLELLSSWIWL